MSYVPPENPLDYDFIDEGYSAPLSPLDFDFSPPLPPSPPETVKFSGGIKLSNVIIK